MTVAWKTMWIALVGRPCFRRVLRANNVCAHAARRWSTCCVTESLRLIVTPRALIDSTRATPGTAGGGITTDLLVCGDTKTISADLTRFSCRLFSLAQSSICAISVEQDWMFDAGMMR